MLIKNYFNLAVIGNGPTVGKCTTAFGFLKHDYVYEIIWFITTRILDYLGQKTRIQSIATGVYYTDKSG
jgi:hypothetical protein